jgi:hypothetical protein
MFKGVYGIKRLADQNPNVMMAWCMGITAVAMPFVVVPIRESLGFRTNQYTKVSRKPIALDDEE